MAWTVFIDGKEGTTGLRIFDRLAERGEFSLLTLPEEKRKDADARREAIHAADIAILCLPDAAARESVALAEGSNTRILDTSTAHRVAPGWAYGFPELSKKHRAAVVSGQYVAVPGCHAKKMIAQYEADTRTPDLDAPRPYGLTQSHKHLPEMQQISRLTHAPIFAPIVADYYAGMQVTIPLFRQQLNCAHPVEELTACLKAHYVGSPIVSVLVAQDVAAFGGFIPANALAGKDSMKLMVLGNDDRIELVSLFDNLGKGSSGAAIECLNLMTGAPETTGLNL